MFVDTHTHLYLPDFDADRNEMLQRAKEAGVTKFFMPNIDSTSIEAMLEVEQRHPESCFPMMGLHPCSVKENFEEELAIARQWLSSRHFSAIGEIGIDLFWDTTFLAQQKIAFRQQIHWAKEMQLPVVIHSRNSIDLLIQIIKEEKDNQMGGIFHCFTGTLEQAQEIIELGFYLGIGGVLTFKNAGLDETVKDIPLENIVLETDSPYLAPVPFRGKRNECAYLRLVAEKLAEVKTVTLEEISAVTSANAEKIFRKKTQAYTTLS
jgi:TatD DNase family protein